MVLNNKYLKIGIISLFIIIFLFLILRFNIFNKDNIVSLVSQGSENRSFGIFFVVFIALLLVFFVPISWLSLIAAIFFGLKGALYMTVAGLISATISFGIARIFKEDVSKIIERLYYRKKRELTLDEIYSKIKEYGFGYVVFLRSVPFIPFSIANYIFGISFVPYRDFIIATLLSVSIGQTINIYFFYKAMKIGEKPLDTLFAAVLKGVYFLVLILWSRKSKYNAKE